MNKNEKKPIVKDQRLAIDMLHYRANRLSFWLIFLTIALNIAMFLIIYTTTACTPGIQLGIDLLVNVLFMLAAFLAAEKTKKYSKEWGIGSIVLGVIQALRCLWIPLIYFLDKGLSTGKFVACVALLVISGGSMVFAGIYCLIKHKVIVNNRPILEVEGEKKDVRT